MFGFFFGWRKASKCKKLIRKVQRRVKLLKNKRCSIVKLLREDIAELLKHGHEQTAFDRVEQLYKDESMVTLYNLLDSFCGFIISNLPYIRKHKDCPNDINEAVSSLIYASARCGDLPELILIRKLFVERYGQRFATDALELLPGNLVNLQIKEKLCIESISEDTKYKLVEEIASGCFKSGPLLIEYHPELHQQPVNHDGDEVNKKQDDSSILETEAKVLYVDFSSERGKFIKDSEYNEKSIMSVPSICSSTSQADSNMGESSMHEEQGQAIKSVHLHYTVSGLGLRDTSGYTKTHLPGSTHDNGGMIVDSSSESSDKLPMEMIYLDDIEELESPVRKEGNIQDQRLFMFKSTLKPPNEKIFGLNNTSLEELSDSKDQKRGSRSYLSSNKVAGKRLRRRSISLEKRSVIDIECTVYYSQSSPKCSHKPQPQRKHQKKVKEKVTSNCTEGSTDVYSGFVNINKSFTVAECIHDHLKSCCRCTSKKVSNCSLEDPCYFCPSDETDHYKCPASMSITKNESLKRLLANKLMVKNIEHGSYYYKCSGDDEELDIYPQKTKVHQDLTLLSYDLLGLDYLSSKVEKDLDMKVSAGDRERKERGDSVLSKSSRVDDQSTIKEIQLPYLRAATMPPERLKDNSTEIILRSNSFPVHQSSNLQEGSASNRHVHPKLPDYDELAAKFTALKKARLKNKQ